MYKRILVALDGSLSASLALEEALKLAQPVDAMLMVACVVSHDLCDLVGGVIGEEAGDAGAHRQLDHVRDLCERSGVQCITQIIDAHGAGIRRGAQREGGTWASWSAPAFDRQRRGIGFAFESCSGPHRS